MKQRYLNLRAHPFLLERNGFNQYTDSMRFHRYNRTVDLSFTDRPSLFQKAIDQYNSRVEKDSHQVEYDTFESLTTG